VIGIRRGWGGLIEIDRRLEPNNQEYVMELTEEVSTRSAAAGGTFLHTSRTRPSHVPS